MRVSSDYIREMFFKAGYNFDQVRPFIGLLLERLTSERYDIFLDFNISTNIPILDMLKTAGYRIFVIHANPPESFIKEKILTGNMKHELTFFPKDEHVYESMLGWREEHYAHLPELKQKHGIWYEVDTSRTDLKKVIRDMSERFARVLRNGS